MDWNGPLEPVASEFDKKVAALGLKYKPERHAHSRELKAWIREHYRSRYVPEHLLELWGLTLDVD